MCFELVKKQKYATTQPTPHSFALGVISDLNFLLENGIFYMKYTTKNTIITDINCIHFNQQYSTMLALSHDSRRGHVGAYIPYTTLQGIRG